MYCFIKRSFDFIVALIACPFILLLTIFVGLAIKIEDGGKVFYLAKRIGKDGKIFNMYKFRSMKENAPDIRLEDGSTYNSDDDQRVTKVGRILRKTSFDEIPQLLNVLLGQMSLVGPRPDSASWIDNYTEDEKIILTVKPGITGYNQVINRNSVSTHEKLQNDIFYVKNKSILLDIKILFLTIKTVFCSKNINRDSVKILVLGASDLQLPAISKAKMQGYKVAVVDYDKKAVGIDICDKYYECSTLDADAVLRAAKDFGANAIVTMATDMPMRVVAKVSKELKLKSISEGSAFKATNKIAMIESFCACGVAVPWYKKIDTLSDLETLSDKIPFILKPSESSGSRGVFLVNKSEDIALAYNYSSEFSNTGLIAEEYLQGNEISIESFAINGISKVIQITDKVTTGAPYFVEKCHIQPSRKAVGYEQEIENIVAKVYKSLDILDGPMHIEAMITEKGVYIIEAGARLGGDNISSYLVPLSTGCDLVLATINSALGKEVDLTKKWEKFSMVLYLENVAGVLKSVTGVDDAINIKGVEKVAILRKIGEKICESRNSAERIGYIIVSGESYEEILQISEKAKNCIKIDVE